jgi:hypothetical protein
MEVKNMRSLMKRRHQKQKRFEEEEDFRGRVMIRQSWKMRDILRWEE